ncbi:MAG: EFR1 family ferrodoxin [bacterium]
MTAIKPKLTLFYFSGSGNTKFVAEKFVEEFAHNHLVELVDIDEFFRFGKEFDPDFQKGGVIYPVHAFNAPANVLKFLKNSLPKGEGRKFFIVKSPGDPFFDGGSTAEVRKILIGNGYAVSHESLIVMPANVFLRFSDSLISKIMEVADKRIKKAVLEIDSGETVLSKNPWLIRFSTWILSRLETFGGRFFGKDLKVNKNCDSCGICQKVCPMGNISLKNGDKPRFGWKCMICMRCIYSCPQDAIAPLFLKFFKVENFYNIKEFPKKNDDSDPTLFEKGFRKYFEDSLL